MTDPYGITQYNQDGCLDESYDFLGYLKSVVDLLNDRIGAEELARAVADAALSLRIDGLNPGMFDAIELELANLSARITQESSIRVEGDEIIAEQINTIAVTADNAAASVVQEAIARASAISAMAGLVTTVSARVDGAETAIITEQTARATADTALATQITTVSARVDSTEASITSEQTTRVNAIAALANTLTVLTTRVGSAESLISTESVARTAENYSLATRVDIIEAGFASGAGGDVSAMITAEATARADADIAFANQLNTLSSNITGVDSSVRALITAETASRVSADSALATQITSITSSFTGGSGNLVNNSDFANGVILPWTTWQAELGSYSAIGVNLPNADWHPVAERVLSVTQNGRVTGNDYHPFAWVSQDVAIIPDQYYQAYAYVAAHRASVAVFLVFRDDAGNWVEWFAGDAVPLTGGVQLSNYSQVGVKSAKAPAGATRMHMEVRKNNTNEGETSSWMWFLRPYMGSARQGQTTFNNFSHGQAGGGLTDALAKITTEASTRASADSALATRATTLEAQMNNAQGSALQSRIFNEENTRASQTAALATRTTTIESRAGANPDSSNFNPDFQVWSDPNNPPEGWSWWAAEYGIARNPGINGRQFSAGFNINGATASGIVQHIQDLSFGAYVFEFSGRASTWQGAGVLVQFFDENWNYLNEWRIVAATDPDTSGYSDANGGGGAYTRTWSKFFQTPIDGRYRRVRIYAMGNWDGMGTQAPKTITFDRVSIRPATAAEIAGQRADVNATQALANITSEANTRASADGALASQINSVTTTLNGQTATINSTASSVNGLLLKHGVRLNSNGHVTGFEQNNNGSTGSFTVVADNFSVVAPGGGTPVVPLSVTAEGVRINGGLMVNGSIVTNGIANNAVTVGVSAYSPDDVILPFSGAWQNLQSVVISTSGGAVTIWSQCTLAGNGGGSFSEPRLLRNGAELRLGSVRSGNDYNGQDGIIMFVDNAPAGVHTYTLEARYVNGTFSAVAYQRFLSALETKK